MIVNYGRVTNSALTLRIRQYEASGQLIGEQLVTQPSTFYADTRNWLVPNHKATSLPSYFELFLDPDDRIHEGNETNNKAEIGTDGQTNSLPFAIDLTPHCWKSPLMDNALVMAMSCRRDL
ncbi:hypothetical protein GO730_09600 [Spirosoma sp. HMF3257]|uniref:CARDB domain-containing protein n=1 Tax=Spirosoma telluris TaxID=2183553 RepID=A0A327NP48_9BACT|nr:hypothetical protein [Spirosoma telluris]RAI74448.1 hypothetical protein HMF3257_09505 [Spirosoma telluris]